MRAIHNKFPRAGSRGGGQSFPPLALLVKFSNVSITLCTAEDRANTPGEPGLRLRYGDTLFMLHVSTLYIQAWRLKIHLSRGTTLTPCSLFSLFLAALLACRGGEPGPLHDGSYVAELLLGPQDVGVRALLPHRLLRELLLSLVALMKQLD